MLIRNFIFTLFFVLISAPIMAQSQDAPYVLVLGIAQDGGYPHPGCSKKCCLDAMKYDTLRKYVSSLALVDPEAHKWWLFDATPDIKEQLQYFRTLTNGAYNYLPDGIFLTHAHIGHYTGLMILGREVMNTHDVAVYALPRMKNFLETNGPWSQLVSLNNISIHPAFPDSSITLSTNISVKPLLVPHRDEFSETAGFRITTTGKNYLFIPDINKWQKWDRSILSQIDSVDIALIDGTFYSGGELPAKTISEVPHPFMEETMMLFANAPNPKKSKIHFIHFNHTNPILWNTNQQTFLLNANFNIAWQGEKL